jgi:hypothetical protein
MTKAKEIVGFDCAGSAADGIKIVLSVRVEEMCELRASALDWTDLEGVHHMRVASPMGSFCYRLLYGLPPQCFS